MISCTNKTPMMYSGPLRIVGSGHEVRAELARAPYPDAPIMAVNLVGLFLPTMLHWVSVHHELFEHVLPLRNFLYPDNRTFYTHAWYMESKGVDFVWYGSIAPDFSGCLALMIALSLGYSPIVLCGLGQDGTGHYYDLQDQGNEESYPFRHNTWSVLAEHYRDSVIPMGGKVKRLFEQGSG